MNKQELTEWCVANIVQWPDEVNNYLPKPIGFSWFSLMSGMPVKLGSVNYNIQVNESDWESAGGGV